MVSEVCRDLSKVWRMIQKENIEKERPSLHKSVFRTRTSAEALSQILFLFIKRSADDISNHQPAPAEFLWIVAKF